MAAGTWKVPNTAKSKLGLGTLNLSGEFRLALFTSASNLKSSASALPRGIYNSLTSEVASGNGYATGGYALTSENWIAGRSAKEYKFSVASFIFTASGGTIPNIKFAAIVMSAAASAGKHIAAYVTLTTSQFTLAQNNTATLTPPTNGVFYMV